MIIQILKRFYRLQVAILLVSPLRLLKFYDKNSDNIIWIRDNNLKYFLSTSFLWDLANINFLTKRGQKFKIIFGLKVGFCFSKNIFYSLHPRYGVLVSQTIRLIFII